MNELRPDRDDFIHRVFRHLRTGFSDIVVNLVDRVDKRLEIFIDDERHVAPEMDDLAVDAVRDTAGVFSSTLGPLVTSANASDAKGKSEDNEPDNSEDTSSDAPGTD